EDDADVRGALTAVLEGEGYHVVEAAHGQEALQHLRADAAGLCMILLDLWIPVMNGWEFRAEQLKSPTLAEGPVVAVAASPAAALVQFCYDCAKGHGEGWSSEGWRRSPTSR